MEIFYTYSIQHAAIGNIWLLSTGNVANVTKELNFT